MRKTLLVALALLTLVACEKESPTVDSPVSPQTFQDNANRPTRPLVLGKKKTIHIVLKTCKWR